MSEKVPERNPWKKREKKLIFKDFLKTFFQGEGFCLSHLARYSSVLSFIQAGISKEKKKIMCLRVGSV